MPDKAAMIDGSGQISGQGDAQSASPALRPEQAPRSEQALRPQGDAMRFHYATGARPLEGYTIKRGIGIGGFGHVYYAVSDAGKEVALKHIQRNLDVELRGVSQCLNLKHPNLLALYDIRYDEVGEGWVVMEFIPGESLRDVLDRNPNGMPHEQIAFWLAGMSAGVTCLHDNGIVHRDLKPGNVFNDTGIIKIGDYGLSKFISVSRRSAQTESVGTFHYMAPEIGRGRYGREIDVYAMGVILYEMLTGDVPFDGESSQEIIMKHLTAEPNLEDVPHEYRAVVAAALVKDPEKRLSSVPQMLQMLNIGMASPGAATLTSSHSAVPPVRSSSPSTLDAVEDEDVEPVVIEDELAEDTLYIDEDSDADEIEFGPVEHRLQSVAVGQRSHANPNRQAASTPPEEPIARAIYFGWNRLSAWFSNPNTSSPLKALTIMLIGVLGAIALFSLPWTFLPLVVLGLFYAFYYAVRVIVISFQSEEEERQRSGAAEGLRRWQESARLELAARPWPKQMSELIGGLIVSAAIAGVLSVVGMIVSGQPMDGAITGWGPQMAWFGLAAVAGSWAVLVAGKVFALREGDQIMRRLTMLGVGLGVGLLAWSVAAGFMLEMKSGPAFNVPNTLYNSVTRQPTLPAYLAYFGGLFFILRWWLQADPLRNVRFNLWASLLCGLWGLIMPFPQPWGVLLALTISIAVQLAAPWVNKPERNRIRQQFRLQDAQGVRRL